MDKTEDHDILITLVQTVKSNHLTILEKVKDLHTDMTEVKDGTKTQLLDHEHRIQLIEATHLLVDPEGAVKMVKANNDWIHDFNLTWKFVIGFSVTLSSIISFILGFIINAMKLVGG